MTDPTPVIEAARETFPWWVGFGRLGIVLLAALVAYLCMGLAMHFGLRPLRRLPPNAHWTERARCLFPVRAASPLLLCLLALSFWFYPMAEFRTLTFSRVGRDTLSLLGTFAALLAAFAQQLRVERKLGSTLRVAARLRQVVTGWLLFFPHAAVGLGALFLLLGDPRVGLVACATFALLSLVLVRGLNLRIASLLGLVRPADARLQGIVQGVSERVAIPVVRSWVLPDRSVNAFAFVHARELVYTDRALASLHQAELEALTAHELAHLSEPTRVRRTRAAMSLTWLCLVAPPLLGLWLGQDARIAFGLGVVLGLVLTVRFKRLSRSMEERADAFAVQHEPERGAFVRALAKLHELNLLPVVTGPATHPSAYDRFVAAGFTPDYQRPAPPARGPMFAFILVGFAPAWCTYPLLMKAVEPLRERAPVLALALTGRARELDAVAEARAKRGDGQGTLLLYGAISELLPHSAGKAANAAWLAAKLKRCDEALPWVERAQQRADKNDETERRYVADAEKAYAACKARQQFDLGSARWQVGDLRSALGHYEEARKLEPGSPFWHAEVARLYSGLGRCAEAQGALDVAEQHLSSADAQTVSIVERARVEVAYCPVRVQMASGSGL